MPGTPAEFIERLQSVDIMQVVVDVFEKTKDAYLNLNRDQFKHGDKSTGKGIGIYANAGYALEKYSMNPEAGLGRVDLMLTHAFEKALFVDIYPDKFLVGSLDSKADQLDQDYGEDIYGLSPSHQQSYNFDVFLPEFLKKITNLTGIGTN
jgi:hypothetical protein